VVGDITEGVSTRRRRPSSSIGIIVVVPLVEMDDTETKNGSHNGESQIDEKGDGPGIIKDAM
jgi:hypothetical protein